MPPTTTALATSSKPLPASPVQGPQLQPDAAGKFTSSDAVAAAGDVVNLLSALSELAPIAGPFLQMGLRVVQEFLDIVQGVKDNKEACTAIAKRVLQTFNSLAVAVQVANLPIMPKSSVDVFVRELISRLQALHLQLVAHAELPRYMRTLKRKQIKSTLDEFRSNLDFDINQFMARGTLVMQIRSDFTTTALRTADNQASSTGASPPSGETPFIEEPQEPGPSSSSTSGRAELPPSVPSSQAQVNSVRLIRSDEQITALSSPTVDDQASATSAPPPLGAPALVEESHISSLTALRFRSCIQTHPAGDHMSARTDEPPEGGDLIDIKDKYIHIPADDSAQRNKKRNDLYTAAAALSRLVYADKPVDHFNNSNDFNTLKRHGILTAVYDVPQSKQKLLVGWSAVYKTPLVAFRGRQVRGTQDFDDLIACIKSHSSPDISGHTFPEGFRARCDSVEIGFFSALLREAHDNHGTGLVICGHSLGGALSRITGIRLIDQLRSLMRDATINWHNVWEDPPKISTSINTKLQSLALSVITFGCPESIHSLKSPPERRSKELFHNVFRNKDVVTGIDSVVEYGFARNIHNWVASVYSSKPAASIYHIGTVSWLRQAPGTNGLVTDALKSTRLKNHAPKAIDQLKEKKFKEWHSMDGYYRDWTEFVRRLPNANTNWAADQGTAFRLGTRQPEGATPAEDASVDTSMANQDSTRIRVMLDISLASSYFGKAISIGNTVFSSEATLGMDPSCTVDKWEPSRTGSHVHISFPIGRDDLGTTLGSDGAQVEDIFGQVKHVHIEGRPPDRTLTQLLLPPQHDLTHAYMMHVVLKLHAELDGPNAASTLPNQITALARRIDVTAGAAVPHMLAAGCRPAVAAAIKHQGLINSPTSDQSDDPGFPREIQNLLPACTEISDDKELLKRLGALMMVAVGQGNENGNEYPYIKQAEFPKKTDFESQDPQTRKEPIRQLDLFLRDQAFWHGLWVKTGKRKLADLYKAKEAEDRLRAAQRSGGCAFDGRDIPHLKTMPKFEVAITKYWEAMQAAGRMKSEDEQAKQIALAFAELQRSIFLLDVIITSQLIISAPWADPTPKRGLASAALATVDAIRQTGFGYEPTHDGNLDPYIARAFALMGYPYIPFPLQRHEQLRKFAQEHKENYWNETLLDAVTARLDEKHRKAPKDTLERNPFIDVFAHVLIQQAVMADALQNTLIITVFGNSRTGKSTLLGLLFPKSKIAETKAGRTLRMVVHQTDSALIVELPSCNEENAVMKRMAGCILVHCSVLIATCLYETVHDQRSQQVLDFVGARMAERCGLPSLVIFNKVDEVAFSKDEDLEPSGMRALAETDIAKVVTRECDRLAARWPELQMLSREMGSSRDSDQARLSLKRCAWTKVIKPTSLTSRRRGKCAYSSYTREYLDPLLAGNDPLIWTETSIKAWLQQLVPDLFTST